MPRPPTGLGPAWRDNLGFAPTWAARRNSSPVAAYFLVRVRGPRDGRVLGRSNVIRRLAGQLTLIGLVAASSAVARTEEQQLPNLVPKPAYALEIAPSLWGDPGTSALQFATAAVNAGGYPLDIVGGGIQNPEQHTFVAQQCVEWIAPRACLRREDVGTIHFEFAVTHLHFHFDLFAQYELRRFVNGAVDETPEGIVAPIEKRSFCLQDTGPYGRPPLGYAESPPFYVTCAGLAMGVSAGWEDEYGPGVYGQELPMIGIQDGTYALRIVLNFDHRVRETSYDDNTSTTIFTLSGGGTTVMVL